MWTNRKKNVGVQKLNGKCVKFPKELFKDLSISIVIIATMHFKEVIQELKENVFLVRYIVHFIC